MMELDIRIADSVEELNIACNVMNTAQDAESEKTKIQFNTHGLNGEMLYTQLNEDDYCLILYENDIPAATLCVFEEIINTWYYKGKAGRIKYVGVMPSCQGKGFAVHLIDYLKKHAAESNCPLIVSTDSRNQNAVNLYKSCGFVVVGISRGKGAGSNALILAYYDKGFSFSDSKRQRFLFVQRAKCKVKEWLRY